MAKNIPENYVRILNAVIVFPFGGEYYGKVLVNGCGSQDFFGNDRRLCRSRTGPEVPNFYSFERPSVSLAV
jgi:hypothetical protein